MNDKLIAMAKECGFGALTNHGINALQAFAKLIRKEQIEIDAEICSEEGLYKTAHTIRTQEIK